MQDKYKNTSINKTLYLGVVLRLYFTANTKINLNVDKNSPESMQGLKLWPKQAVTKVP